MNMEENSEVAHELQEKRVWWTETVNRAAYGEMLPLKECSIFVAFWYRNIVYE